jgi:pyrroloquinoline quinone (PQQ) biosynthesis protein C
MLPTLAGVAYRDEAIPTAELVEELDAILEHPSRNRKTHPVVLGLEQGSLTREQIAGWIYQITCWANPTNVLVGDMYARCPDEDLRHMLLENLTEEEHGTESGTAGHVELFARTFTELGWTEERRQSEEIKPETWALAHWFEVVMTRRTLTEAVAALSFSAERINPGIFQRVETALRQNYELSEWGIQSISVHASHVEEEHGSLGPTTFERYATTPLQQNDLRFVCGHTGDLYYGQWNTYTYY